MEELRNSVIEKLRAKRKIFELRDLSSFRHFSSLEALKHVIY